MGKTQRVDIFTSIFRTIINREAKINKNITKICICTNCKQEIDFADVYLRFSGELLHGDCLVDYLRKLHILDVVIPHHDYNPCEGRRNGVKIDG